MSFRFTKDDQAKDKHIASLENELKEISKKLEDLLDEYQHSKPTPVSNANKIEAQRESAKDNGKPKSKFCIILWFQLRRAIVRADGKKPFKTC